MTEGDQIFDGEHKYTVQLCNFITQLNFNKFNKNKNIELMTE